MELYIKNSTFQFLFGLLVAVAFVPGWIGASISTNWLVLFLVLPIVICYYSIPATPSHLFGILFLAYATCSLLWSVVFNISFFFLLQLIALGLAFCYGSAIKDLRPLVKGMAFGLGVSSAIALAQLFGFKAIYTLDDRIAGLFVNQNILCEASAIFFIALVIYKLYWWLPVTLPGLIVVHSRAAILSLSICALIWLWARSRTAVYILVPVLFLIGVAYSTSASFSFDSVQERISLYKDTINGFVPFGNGVGSFETLFPYYATNIQTWAGRPNYAHNDMLQLIFEFGIGTVFLVILIWNILNVDREERIILYGFGIISLFSFPLHIPMLAFLICLVAGNLTRYDGAYEYYGLFRRSILFKRHTLASAK